MRNLKTIQLLLSVAAILLLTCSLSMAQTITTGDLTGTLTDSTGAVIPQATVTLKSLTSGTTRTVQSNDQGVYRFSLLDPGSFEVSATSSGLRSDIGRVIVGVGQVTTANMVLKVEESKQVILVTEAAPVLQADNANLAATFSSTQVDVLPLPGGDITSVAFTVPGITVSTGGGYGNFSSHGLPGISNLFTINGVDEMDPYLNLNNSGASNLTLGQNEIQEVSVVQNPYSVEYGRQAGAQINFVTKSGSNQWHGSLLYTYNGSFMNANDFFNNETGTQRPRAISNQWGGLVSGPIKKDKLFFLFDTEGLRYVLPSTATVSVPSAALESYVLKNILPSQSAYYQKAFSLYNSAPGANNAVRVQNGDGLLQDSNGGLGCGALAGGPDGSGGTFGVTTSCANAYNVNLTNENKEWLLTTRVDYNIDDKNKIFGRYKMDHGLQPTDTQPISPLFNAVSNQPAYEGALTWSSVISPRMVNQLVLSSSYYSAIFSPANVAASLAAFPNELVVADGGANGTGGLTQLGFSAGTFPQGRRVGQAEIIDDFSYTLGKHNLKFGMNYRYNRVTDTGNETLTQGGVYTVVGLDEFSSGSIVPSSGSTFSQRFANFPVVHVRLYNVGFYAQDEWAVTPTLKVTLGLRFDRNGNPSCNENCFTRLDSPFQTLASHAITTPYNQSIQTGNSNAFYSIEPVIAAPRVAFAWSPRFAKHTVIRGGVGLFADQFPAYFIGSLFNQAPNNFTSTVHQGLINSAGTGTAPVIAASSAAAFESGFSNGATLPQLQAAVAPVSFTAPAYFSIANQLNASKYVEWNFEIQQQFAEKNVVSIGYVGNHGYDIFDRNGNLNAANTLGNYPAGFAGLPTTTPDPRFHAVTGLDNSGYSNYDGMTVQYRRSLTAGLQGQINYTWSHALDTVSNGGLSLFFNGFSSIQTQINPFNKNLNYSNSDYDTRHQITADFTYAVPFKSGHAMLRNILGGWNAGAKIFYHTGFPFSVTDSRVAGRLSASNSGSTLADVVNFGAVGTSCGPSAVDTPCLASSSFAVASGAKAGQVLQFDLGNIPRNSFRAPGYVDTDLTVYKTFPIWNERSQLKIGAQAYNLFNHPNFAPPSSNVAVGGLGLLNSTVDAPTSPYGSFQGSAVSGRVLALTGRITF